MAEPPVKRMQPEQLELAAVRSVKFLYRYAEDYNPCYANGAQGGITTQKEICLNFYLERMALPREETYAVEEGKVGTQGTSVPPHDPSQLVVMRYIATGVLLSPKAATELRDFLSRQLMILQSAEAPTASPLGGHD